MKRLRHIAGVTLLEIMLVLAIAAMIIVMSIRYYQSATAGAQTNAVLSQIQGIIAASDQLAQATGTYTGIDDTKLKPLLPNNTFNTPWGTTMTYTGSASSFVISVPGVPAGVCPLLKARLELNNHIKATTGTCGNAPVDMSFTYTANV
jgi:type II secretory pathway pseudopilin PulG